MKITVPALFNKLSTLSDGSIKVEFVTQELSGEEASYLLGLRKSIGWLLFSEESLTEADIPEEKPDGQDKTPSQRFRSRMAVAYHAKKGTYDGFNRFYEAELERLGQQYLEQIDG